MSSHDVDGLILPLDVGGHPALDFCNTRAGWGSSSTKEYLQTYDHLAVWAREAGLLAAGPVAALRAAAREQPAAAQRVLRRALAFREAVYPVALDVGSVAFAVVAAHTRSTRQAATLARRPDVGGPVACWVLPDDHLEAPVLAAATAVEDLLCSPLSRVVAVCAGRGCGWLFADPRRRRRWCDMAVCGNRAKARRYAGSRRAR